MRALWLPACIVTLTVLASLVGAQASDVGDVAAVQNPLEEQQSASGQPPLLPPSSGSGATNPPPEGEALPRDGVDLGTTLAPDVGSAFYLVIGVGLGLLGLAAASLLGTRFVTNENVLENDARRAIFEYIKTNPGCHLRETANALQLSTTNVLWHLRKLEESNLVAGKKLEGYKVFYPVEGGVEAKRMGLALAVLRNPNARQVLGNIARNPGIHQREIARLLDVNHGTVRWHLKKLGIVQLVLEVKKGAVSQYYISALGLQALEKVEVRPVVEELTPPPLAPLAGTAGTATPAAQATTVVEAHGGPERAEA